MLQITVKASELYNPIENSFFTLKKDQTLVLEHSLISLSKWESKWNIPFYDPRRKKTEEQTIDYIRCMTLAKNVDDNVYMCLTAEDVKKIEDYIDAPMTATTFYSVKGTESKNQRFKTITSEVIYALMIQNGIPVEFEKWHLNRLMTLIRVLNELNKPEEKIKRMSKESISNRNKLNSFRKAQYHTNG